MSRGQKKEVVYKGNAAKIHERILKLEAELKAAKADLKVAYKEQVKADKEAEKKAQKEQQDKLLKAIAESGKTPEEIMELLKS